LTKTARTEVVHYDTGFGFAACGMIKPKLLSCAPRKVTCTYCQETHSFKEMMK
jgi:hypothetical protein